LRRKEEKRTNLEGGRGLSYRRAPARPFSQLNYAHERERGPRGRQTRMAHYEQTDRGHLVRADAIMQWCPVVGAPGAGSTAPPAGPAAAAGWTRASKSAAARCREEGRLGLWLALAAVAVNRDTRTQLVLSGTASVDAHACIDAALLAAPLSIASRPARHGSFGLPSIHLKS
jgi:hypothetical protein